VPGSDSSPLIRFDWKEYLSIAEQYQDHDREAYQRTAAEDGGHT